MLYASNVHTSLASPPNAAMRIIKATNVHPTAGMCVCEKLHAYVPVFY